MTVPTLKLDSAIGDLTDYGIEPKPTIHRGGGPQQNGFIADAGQLTNCTLDNISRDLDPLWTSGPFFGTLRRNLGVTLTATWGATEYPVLVGRADDIPQLYPDHGTNQIVDFGVTDLFDWLNTTPINTVRPPERTDQRIQFVLDWVGWPGAMDIQPGLSMVCGQDLNTVAALSHLGDVAQVEYGEMGVDAEGTFYFRGRPAIATDTRSTVVQAEYVQSGDGFRFVDITRGELPIINEAVMTYGRDGRQVTARDTVSISAYDQHSVSVSLPFATYSQARVYGKWLLLLYGTPRSTITSVTFDLNMTEEPGDDNDLWAEILSRKEGDLVQITLDPLAGTTVSGEPLVRSMWWRGVDIDFDASVAVVQLQDSWVDGLFYWDSSDLDGPDYYGP